VRRHLLPLLLLPFLAGGGIAGGEGDPVAPGQKVAEILSPAADGAAAGRPREASGGSTALRLLLGAGALLALGAVALAARARRTRLGGIPAIEPVDVVGRASLSPRHSVCVVRVAGRRIVLGIAGERMTALAVVEDRAPEAPARGFTSRLGEAGRRPAPPADLEPYRKQVDRLRGMLRGPFAGGGQPPPEEP
jgi:flagellar biogenesis protein FliO